MCCCMNATSLYISLPSVSPEKEKKFHNHKLIKKQGLYLFERPHSLAPVSTQDNFSTNACFLWNHEGFLRKYFNKTTILTNLSIHMSENYQIKMKVSNFVKLIKTDHLLLAISATVVCLLNYIYFRI